MAPKYFSAQISEASKRFARRVKFTCRENGASFFRECFPVAGQNNEAQLRAAVRSAYTSPTLSVEVLWYDKSLETLFYRVFDESDRGHGRKIAYQ